MTIPRNSRRLKYASTINDEALSESTDEDYQMLYVDIGDVTSKGQILGKTEYRLKNAPSRARRIVRDGDVIVSTVRTYLQAIASIENPEENLIVSTGFAVVRPDRELLDAQFFKYAAREYRFLKEIEARSKGISYPAINSSELAEIFLSCPSLKTQRRIADYLDRETARIDALIEEKESMLKLLEEKRSAMISQAVTRGLNPDGPLKPSGLDWLGDIPKHWQVTRAKGIFKEVDQRSEDGTEELLSLRMEKGLVPHREVSDKIIEPEDVIRFKIVQAGQLVINRMRASMGLIAISPMKGLVSPDYAVFDVIRPVEFRFFLELFNTSLVGSVFHSASRGMGTGSQGFLRLYTENFLSLHFAVPPLAEQKAIVGEIEAERQKTAQLADALRESIALLHERRSALITAAVTGEIPEEEMTA